MSLALAVAMSVDSTALEIVSAQTRGNLNGVTVTFSAPVAAATATNPATYAINNGVVVTSVPTLEATKVRLNSTATAEGQVYTLTVNGVLDSAIPPNTIAPNSRINFLQTQGVITRKEFDDISGSLLADLTNHLKFPNSPDIIDYPASLETPVDVRDNYRVQFLGSTTNRISVRVTDNGSPPFSDIKSFTIVVSAPAGVPMQLGASMQSDGNVNFLDGPITQRLR